MFIRQIAPLGFVICSAIVVACSWNTNGAGVPMRAASLRNVLEPQVERLTPPPKNWSFYSPNPFASPICDADPCSPRLDRDSASMVDQMMRHRFSMGIIQVAEPGTGGGEAQSDEIPIYYTKGGSPHYLIDCTKRYTPRCSRLFPEVPIPNGAYASADKDHHASVILRSQGQTYEYDFWEFNCPPNTGRQHGKCIGTTTPVRGGGTVLVSYGGACNANSYADAGTCTGSAIAAGVPPQAGVLDPRALSAGPIKHVLYVAIGCPNGHFVWPAHVGDGYPKNCQVPGGPPEGKRIWLDLTDSAIGRLSDPRWAKVILHAMHHYGFFVVDTAGDFKQPWNFYGLDSATFTYLGETDPWATFFTSIGCDAHSNPCGYSKNASHLPIPIRGISQSNIHIIR